jgi:hypothetical protein
MRPTWGVQLRAGIGGTTEIAVASSSREERASYGVERVTGGLEPKAAVERRRAVIERIDGGDWAYGELVRGS